MTAVPHLLDDLHLSHLLSRDDLTVDDVASLPEDLRYELLDGRLVLLPIPFPMHNWIARQVAQALDRNASDEAFVNIETSVAIGTRSELRPDAAVIRLEGADRSPVLARDVLVVVEVVSRSSVLHDRRFKAKVYADAGIPLYWVLDPLGEQVTLTVHVLGPDGVYQSDGHHVGRVALEQPWPVALDLDAWTAYRDKVQSRRRQAGSK
ncbi:Uma2 family endonuclease [Actinoplanes sp. RD1]|uniref:Uma2 family endonuclease n=1 Tax=Actinoplanes sp. RD1 TaxID=3064538 RepID=UPI00274254B9|nr:Uma2 family endonuclease [Actinoplanes sp. RD1]